MNLSLPHGTVQVGIQEFRINKTMIRSDANDMVLMNAVFDFTAE